jgi:diaminopimelate epimerase
MNERTFHKMHGLGNDFVIMDCREEPFTMTAAMARHIADRKTGIGCDQIILIEPSDIADIRMLIYNADGGQVESCGNASRCVVTLMGVNCLIETAGGLISGTISENDVSVDMGKPRFEWQEIPLAFAMDSAAMPMAWDSLSSPMAVNVGNPHAIFFVEDQNDVDLVNLGPVIESDAAFPERVNVNVASVINGDIHLRVWERGVGLTQACGTGACATAVAAIKQGLVSSPAKVYLPGGMLTIAWQPGGSIMMTGETKYVFEGSANWDEFG